MINLLKQPFLHFVVLGAALFVLYGVVGPKEEEAAAPLAQIVITSDRIASLSENFNRTQQRAPTDEELQGLIDDYVREEVFYREGTALGLDREDIVIRRRMRQKMEFVADDASIGEPTEEQLVEYLQTHPDEFKKDGTVPPLADIRDAVRLEWVHDKRMEAGEAFYQSLRDRYEVVVETTPKGAVVSDASLEIAQ